MFNIKQLNISVIFCFLAFTLAGCVNFTARTALPEDVEREIEDRLGQNKNGEPFNWGHLGLIGENGKYMLATRTKKLEDGKTDRYSTNRVMFGPLKVKGTGSNILYSQIKTTINKDGPEKCKDIEESTCYIATFDSDTMFACSKENGSQKATTELYKSTTSNDIGRKTEIIPLPKELARKLAQLGGIKEIVFVPAVDLGTGDKSILVNDGKFSLLNYDSMRDCIGSLESEARINQLLFYGSCCSTVTGNGDENFTCDRRC